MTFVYREEKKDVFIPGSNLLGPGSYTLGTPIEASRQCVPFNSTIQRTLFNETPSPVGPGLYSMESTFRVSNGKQSYMFQSKMRRFEGSEGVESKEGQQEIGLNIGDMGKEEKENKKAQARPANIKDRLSNVKTIPSIPTLKESFGYQMNQDEELILNKNPREVMSKLDQFRDKKKKLLKESAWTKSKLTRDPFRPREAVEELTALDTQVKWEGKAMKYRRDEAIISDQRRLALLNMRHMKQFGEYYEPQNAEKAQDSMVKVSEVSVERKVKQRLVGKNFGSTAIRFSYFKTHCQEKETSPPLKSGSEEKLKRFTSLPKAGRFYTNRNCQLPGPGSYSQKNFSEGMFGGNFLKESRFVDLKMDLNPGPGDYDSKSSAPNNTQKFRSIHLPPKLIRTTPSQYEPPSVISTDYTLCNSDCKPRVLCGTQVSNPPRRHLGGIKVQIAEALRQTESQQTPFPQLPETKGRLLKPHLIYKKPKNPNKSSLGPGSYTLEQPYGKPTFNITYS